MPLYLPAMKKLIVLSLLLALWSCSEYELPTVTEKVVAAKATPSDLVVDIFAINMVATITLDFSIEEWNKLLLNYDLNPKNEKKVVSRFTYTTNGRTTVLDSIGLKLKGNTSRRRPEGNTGELHNSFNPDWHHFHMSLDFSKNREAQRFKGLNKVNLKWFKDDPMYAREIYSYDLFQRFGCWTAPRASYCKVNIRVGGEVPAYYGVYVLLESVDEDYIVKRSAHWGSAIGWLWKGGYADNYNANFVQTISMGVEDVSTNPALSQYFAYDLKTRKSELAAGKLKLTQFITDLNTKTGTDFQSWIAQQMDIELFLKTYAANVVFGHVG